MRRAYPATSTVAKLGQLLDVVVDQGDDEARIAPNAPTALLWDPAGSRLVWWMGWDPVLEEGEPTTKAERRAASVFHRWGVWDANAVGEVMRSGATQWDTFPAVSIGYRSDKFGRAQNYDHQLGRNVRVYQPRDAPGPWIVKGGSLRVTARGLMG